MRTRLRASAALAAAAVFTAPAARAGAAPSAAQDLELLGRSCVNESGLLCKGESGPALLDCLIAYRGSVTPRCRTALKDLDPDAPAVRVYGSPASAKGLPVAKPAEEAAAAAKDADAPAFEFSIDESRKSYPIKGERTKELLDQLSASGLKDGADGAGAAQTAAALTFTYSTAPRDKSCAVSSAHVRLKATQTFPEWDEASAGDGELADNWRKVLAVMKIHEDGHKEISIKSGQDFLRRLETLRPLPTCADVDDAVRELYRRHQLDARAQNAAYDAETNHGQKQWEQMYGTPGRGKS
jgi:predicted secreted Zn-dependent protease